MTKKPKAMIRRVCTKRISMPTIGMRTMIAMPPGERIKPAQVAV